MTERVVQLGEEKARQGSEFQSWMDENKAVATLREMLHATDEKLTAMTTAKDKALGALKSWISCEYPIEGKNCGECIVCKLIAELENVK
jgi:hypothetical protein